MQIAHRFEVLDIDSIRYFLPDRTKSDVPLEHWDGLKTDIAQKGLLRPVLVYAHLNYDTLLISRRILQDGFVRLGVLKELEAKTIDAEVKYFIGERGIEIGVIQEIISAENLSYSSPESVEHWDNPPEFILEKDWLPIEGTTYADAKTAHDLVYSEHDALIAELTANGMGDRRIMVYRRVTENEEAQWVYSGYTSQDDSLLHACKKAGLTELQVRTRLLDMRGRG